jgi:hypothetical protein
MSLNLNEINPKFRQLTDLLLFSDQMDLDLSEYKFLLRSNQVAHYPYFWDRFQKASEIFWEKGEQLWSYRLNFLLSLNESRLSKNIEDHLEKRFFALVKAKNHINPQYDIEYLQLLELCKIKFKRKENLSEIKIYLIGLTDELKFDKLVDLVNTFVPMVFADFNEYIRTIARNIPNSARTFEFLLFLEQKGITFNKSPVIDLAYNILIGHSHMEHNIRAFFSIINDPVVMSALKQKYDVSHRASLISLLHSASYQVLEEHHLRNIQHIIELDSSVVDELAIIYADKLYQRRTVHKKSNADRLIRLLKSVPQITPKKILAYLSARNQVPDIKYILSAFPDLRKLAAFV